MRKQLLLAMGFVLIPVLAHSTTYYVATTGSDSNTCAQAQNPSTPMRTINAVLNACLGTAAGAGHIVQVAAGTYVETINNNLPGGTSWSAPFTLKAATIGTVIIQPPVGAERCLTIARATSQYAIISGLVCDGVNLSYDGIKITDSSSGAAGFIRVQDTEIKNAKRQGILVTRSTDNEFIRVTAHDNGITDNSTHGIFIGEAAHRTLIANSTFYNNHAYGIQLYDPVTPPDGCIVRNNRAYTNGTGGVTLYATNTLAYNNVIYNNHTPAGNLLGSAKSGLKVGSNSNRVKLYNNTVYGQKANAGDLGVEVSSGAVNTEVRNNLAYTNATNISDSGTNTLLSNNLTTDPKFVDATTNDFHLQSTSPAIDTGVSISAVPTDYDGTSRPQGPVYDIGAYEFVSAPVALDFALSNGGNPQPVTQGSPATSTITATLLSGAPQSVSFTASGLPPNAMASFSPASCTPTCSTTLTISTLASTPAGTYPITVTGTATGGRPRTTSFTLTVTAPAPPPFDFSLRNGGNQSITQGAAVANTITAPLVSGSAQAVSFSTSGLPLGATASFAPTACAPSCSTSLTVSTSASTPTGPSTITVAGSGGGVTRTTSFTLTVTAPAPPPGATPANFKVAFIGDQGLTSNSVAVLQLIKAQGAQLVIHSGDLDYADSPTAFDNQVTNTLGSKFPYLVSRGNHELVAWAGSSGYQALLQARIDRHNSDPATPADDKISCTGTGANLSLKTSCLYHGLRVLLIDPTAFTDENLFIDQELANSTAIWNVCSWHENQNAMQVGGNSDSVGWTDYEECRKGGALIATAHNHAYARTRTLSNTQTQIVDAAWPGATALRVVPGSTFVFVSGLGGFSMSDQQRCLPYTFPYGCVGEWAKIYTHSQTGTSMYGALFITFNVDGDAKKARGEFFNPITPPTLIDSFTITADPFASPPP